MNISFEIKKIDDNGRYRIKFLMFNHKFIEFIKSNGKILHILFNEKKIIKPNYTSWEECNISNDKFSFYISDNWRSSYNRPLTNIIKEYDYMVTEYTHKYIQIYFNVGYDQIVNADIKDFDKIFIKAMKVLSDSYKNLTI